MTYTTLIAAYAAAYETAMDIALCKHHISELTVTHELGDGGVLRVMASNGDWVEVTIGGKATDLDAPYYELFAVESQGF